MYAVSGETAEVIVTESRWSIKQMFLCCTYIAVDIPSEVEEKYAAGESTSNFGVQQ